MSQAAAVLLLGFSTFEKSALESFFRLSSRRLPSYRIVAEPAQALVVLVNGLSPTAVKWANGHLLPGQKALFVGAKSPTGVWPNVPRPIKLAAVLDALDTLAKQSPPATAPRAAPSGTPTQPSPSTPSPSNKPPSPPPTPPAAAPATPRASVRQGSGTRSGHSSFEASGFLGIGKAVPAPAIQQNLDRILVVDDSDVALKFMQNRLPRYGFNTELASSGEEALTLIASGSFKFVFLDVMMEGLDGYQTCRAIKQRKYASGGPPIVVMLTSRGGSIDKIRGSLAGCDAYLTKPLKESEVLGVLSKYDAQVERGFRDTNIGPSSLHSKKTR